MNTSFPHLIRDPETTCRVARVLLRHTRPQNRDEALRLLDRKLGIYLKDRASLLQEVDQYFT